MKNIKFILKYLRPYRGHFCVLLLSIIITVFIACFYPFLFGRIVDELLYNHNWENFINIVLTCTTLYFINQFFFLFLNNSLSILKSNFLYDIRKILFEKIFTLYGKELTEAQSGDFVQRIINDTEHIINFLYWNVCYGIGSVVNLVVAIILLAHIQKSVAIYTVCVTPVVVIISRYFIHKSKMSYDKVLNCKAHSSSWLFEILHEMQHIKLLNASNKVTNKYIIKHIKMFHAYIDHEKVYLQSEIINSTIRFVAQMVLYILSALFIINGDMTLGGFTASVTYFAKCLGVFNSLHTKVVDMGNDMSAIDRIVDLMEKKSEDLTEKELLVLNAKSIVFKNVYFSYIQGVPVLKEFSLQIKTGEKIALVGSSGSGKTTVANLLYRLYNPDSGCIMIDDVNINEYSLAALRSQVGVVHQENIIFDGTIRYNISFQNDSSNDEAIWSALDNAFMSEYIQDLPCGLDTVIGNGGISLSGGQNQRLIIARILYKNPKIIVFDEATSSLDGESEKAIIDCWNRLCENRIIIIIAHRLNAILSADRIAVISEGRVLDVGSHHALMKRCRVYRDLLSSQLEEKFETCLL